MKTCLVRFLFSIGLLMVAPVAFGCGISHSDFGSVGFGSWNDAHTSGLLCDMRFSHSGGNDYNFDCDRPTFTNTHDSFHCGFDRHELDCNPVAWCPAHHSHDVDCSGTGPSMHPPGGVPDSGSSAFLLGFSLAGLVAIERGLRRKRWLGRSA